MVYGGYHPTPEQIKAQQEAREQRIQEKHDELLEEQPNGGKGGPDRSQIDTPLMNQGIPALKDMIMNADPDRIYEVSQHWKQVHNILSGGDGDGKSGGVDSVSAKDSVAGMLQTAVDNVMEHWEGEAAQAFQREAAKLSQRVRNSAAWANLNAEMMNAAQRDLRASREKMRDIKEPSGWDRAWDKAFDDERNDARLLEDIKNGASTEAAAKANADSLSLGKQKQLEAVAVMEQLAVNYKAYAKPRVDDKNPPGDPYSPPAPNVSMPPPITSPGAGAARPGAGGGVPKPWSAGGTSKIGAAPQVPRAQGITGGTPLPPTTGTNVDSVKPGLTGPGLSPGPVGGGGGGGGGGTTGGPGLMVPGGTGGGPRTAGARGGISPVGGGRVGGPSGAGGTGRGNGGRSGMGGMGGGAGAGAGGRAGAGTGGRGALAKARGGVVGAANGIASKGAGGGAGLHGSRGGSQRGGMAGGMAGGMGRGNGRRPEDENSRGERPDYLVEDEETWISEEDRKRNVPRNIE